MEGREEQAGLVSKKTIISARVKPTKEQRNGRRQNDSENIMREHCDCENINIKCK